MTTLHVPHIQPGCVAVEVRMPDNAGRIQDGAE